jgi:hypothetical protein
MFIRTGGPLVTDDYTLMLRSAADGFANAAGELLDGDNDGTPGGDYIANFTVAAGAVTVSLPDVARGPGQLVDIPATSIGLPISISDGSSVNQVNVTLNYDPALLNITAIALAAGLPVDAILTSDLTTAGTAILSLSTATGLTGGPGDLFVLTADIPEDAVYRSKSVLDLNSLSINGGALTAQADDAIQVIAYLGDTTGNSAYSSLDGQRIFRVNVQLDSGFANYPNLDPVIVGDVTGNGSLSALDANRIFQEIVGLDQVELAALPSLAQPIVFGGLDPTLSLPTGLSVERGERVVLPLSVNELPAGLESAEFTLSYDPEMLVIDAVRAGELAAGFGFFHADTTTPGYIRIDTSSGFGATEADADGGVLVELEFTVLGDAGPGLTVIDLTGARLNDGTYTLIPEPVPGADGTDGSLSIMAQIPPALLETPATAVNPEADQPHAGKLPDTIALPDDGAGLPHPASLDSRFGDSEQSLQERVGSLIKNFYTESPESQDQVTDEATLREYVARRGRGLADKHGISRGLRSESWMQLLTNRKERPETGTDGPVSSLPKVIARTIGDQIPRLASMHGSIETLPAVAGSLLGDNAANALAPSSAVQRPDVGRRITDGGHDDRSETRAEKRKRVRGRIDASPGAAWRHAFVNSLAGRSADPNRSFAIALPEARIELDAGSLLPEASQSIWHRLKR